MRGNFIKTLVELAKKDERIVLLTADLGYLALEPFLESFPERYFNVGVAEQNMIGLATGLAEAGFIPFAYSISTFASLRPYEFIRNGPILHQLPVRIIGVGGGYEYGHNGLTHHGLEDVGVMRIQPGIEVVAPADYLQARSALLATWDLKGPVYYRIGKDDRTSIPGLNGRFRRGTFELIGDGKDVLIASMGSVTTEAVRAMEELKLKGVSSTIMVISTLSPVLTEDLAKVLAGFAIVVSVEAHYVVSGIGSLIAEVIAENSINSRLVRLGVRECPDGRTGCQNYFHEKNGLSSEKIVQTVAKSLTKTKRPGEIN